jgi:hypothetical protein
MAMVETSDDLSGVPTFAPFLQAGFQTGVGFWMNGQIDVRRSAPQRISCHAKDARRPFSLATHIWRPSLSQAIPSKSVIVFLVSTLVVELYAQRQTRHFCDVDAPRIRFQRNPVNRPRAFIGDEKIVPAHMGNSLHLPQIFHGNQPEQLAVRCNFSDLRRFLMTAKEVPVCSL